MASRSWAEWARTEFGLSVTGGLACIVAGVVLGMALPPDNASFAEPYRHLSAVLGWTYFVMWSVSFWPQIFINWRRRNVSGLSFDFVALNLLGFSCYSAYNCALLWNDSVRATYVGEYGSLPGVQLNDVMFGLHAVFATLITLAQMAAWRDAAEAQQAVSRPAVALLAALLLAVAVAGALAATGRISSVQCLLAMSYVKLTISLTKYFPQALLNCKRRSTVGWSIHNVLLDFSGGLLSVAQLLMDCVYSGNWSGFIGDPVKFGLGFASMVFDVVFMAQHYVLYRGAAEEEERAAAEGGGAAYSRLKIVES